MTANGPALDLRRLIETLERHGVVYVVIGGIAAIAHGNKRATFDLDVTPQLERDNLERLASALRELNADLRGLDDGVEHDLSPTNADHLALGGNCTLTTDAGALDIMGQPTGAAPYSALAARGIDVQLGGHPIRVVGLDDLIAMKRAAGRPKDLDDVAALNVAVADELFAPQPSPPPQVLRQPAAAAPRCNALLPLVKRRCVLSPGHKGRCRSR